MCLTKYYYLLSFARNVQLGSNLKSVFFKHACYTKHLFLTPKAVRSSFYKMYKRTPSTYEIQTTRPFQLFIIFKWRVHPAPYRLRPRLPILPAPPPSQSSLLQLTIQPHHLIDCLTVQPSWYRSFFPSTQPPTTPTPPNHYHFPPYYPVSFNFNLHTLLHLVFDGKRFKNDDELKVHSWFDLFDETDGNVLWRIHIQACAVSCHNYTV